MKLIENSYSGITLLDKNLKIIYRSPSARGISGWDLTGGTEGMIDNFTHPEDLALVKEAFEKVFAYPAQPVKAVFRTRNFEGYYIWLECVFTNMLDDEDVAGIVCNFIDVTEQKNIEEALNRTVHELTDYKYALDEAAIVAITDQKGIITHVNENFCRISKYSRDELIGNDHRIINSGYHDKDFIKQLWATIANGSIWKGELKNKAKDGSFYWVDTTIVPFLNNKGKPYQYVAIRSDITERKIRHEKVMENGRFIKTITDNLPAIIAYWTSDLQCLFANKGLLDWFQKKPHEVHGIHKQVLLGKKEFTAHEEHINNVLRGTPQSFERTLIRRDGKKIYTYTQYVPDLQGGAVNGFYSLIYDITEVKLAEEALKKQTEQVEHLLDSITDGFIGLDENMCYTYANKQLGKMIEVDPQTLVGRNVWEVFPNAVGSPTFYAIQGAFAKKEFVQNEDYQEHLGLWHENRIYPTGNGLSIFIRDITQRKKEEKHLKLLESVITNTSDSILVTEAEPFDEPGPRIIYVNEAFTKMTGYTPEEVIGQTPRMFQGPKTKRAELDRLKASMQKWEPCEISTINYKKNGDEFWVNISIVPVANDKGWYTHWVAVERDISKKKNEDLQKELLAETSLIFSEDAPLSDTLKIVLARIAAYGDFVLAEFWLVDRERKKVKLAVNHCERGGKLERFLNDSSQPRSFNYNEGFPGKCWANGQLMYWNHTGDDGDFMRAAMARQCGLKRTYAVPLDCNGEVIGILLLMMDRDQQPAMGLVDLFSNFSRYFGAEIRRKQLEQELNQLVTFAPDVICIVGLDGYFKKINPALCKLLDYTEKELLERPFFDFMHPEDRTFSMGLLDSFAAINENLYVENRYLSKGGKIKWLSWSTTPMTGEGLIFCVAKDITDKKELEDLLKKATNLAKIGSWELDLVSGSVYWSAITKEILEVEADFEPTLELGISLYKEGESRNKAVEVVQNAIQNGEQWDEELEVVSPSGINKWVRIIGDAEFTGGICVRLYGSCQDISVRKKAQMQIQQTLNEKNTILESIGDAFFAIDRNWIITYWNKVAEIVLGKQRQEVLDKNIWQVFPEAIGSESYKHYKAAIERQSPVHFEDYYPPLEKWYEVSAYPSEMGLSVYFKDITDRKLYSIKLLELNKNLQKQAKDLAISNAELEQFAYVASHDLQEPLRMVTSFLSQLERKYNTVLDDKGRQYIYFAVDGAKRMRQIILDLLEFSRVGKLEDKLEIVDVNILLQDILILFRKKIEEKHAEVKVGVMPVLNTYITSLRQIFQNLIGNSLKYTEPGGPSPIIEISCVEDAMHWRFKIKDNGIGIEDEYFEKIFIIFQRLHNKDEYSGTGMGLAVSKKIIDSMGGKIWLESKPGLGTTFYFTILKNNRP
ncbi:PAS domain S-box protein [Mucilaginibacter pedocola]|uniref:PAS domain S-box protein n=1 Tax=Mucilaginibacter pedocola TaxID=1792845 RepID=UPI00138FD037|nr:PAS domain S-box protein [Mucilaginibacter pedocola]